MHVSIKKNASSFFCRLAQILRLFGFALILFVGFLPLYAKITQEALQQEVTVTVKLIQIYVTDKEGNPVTDLTQSDFELYEEGKSVRITEFEKHLLSLPGEKPEQATRVEKPAETLVQPPSLTRKFLLFFDFAFNDMQGIPKAKKAALHFIDVQVHPEDEIGIMSYDLFKGLTLHEYFTVEHDKVREVIANFGIKNAGGRAENFAKDDWSEFRDKASAEVADRKIDMASEQIYKNQIRNFVKRMSDLAKALRYIPGTKHIVLFSGGVANIILYGEHIPKTTGGRMVAISPYRKTGDAAMRDIYEVMCKELAASNSLVYPINTAGKGVSHFRARDSMGDFSLRRMAQLSGGNYFDNITSYEDVTAKIQSITSCYYVLGYYVDEKWDGKYHKLKVKVKRRGCQVFGQSGYFNPKPFSEYTKMEKMLHLIDLALSKKPLLQEPYHFPLIALPFAQDQKANCAVITKIPAEKVKDISGIKMEVVTLFFDDDNNIVDMQKSEAGSSSLTQDCVYFYSFFSLVPGDYDCRVVIRNMATGQGAVTASPVVIPETPDSGLVLYPPLLLVENRNACYIKGMEKKKKEEISLSDIYPFDSSQYVPLIKDLDGGTTKIQAAVRCSILGIDNPNLKLFAHLTQPSSSAKIPLEFLVLEQSQNLDSEVWLVEFQMTNLQPGDYTLNLSAEEMKTKSQSLTSVDFIIK